MPGDSYRDKSRRRDNYDRNRGSERSKGGGGNSGDYKRSDRSRDDRYSKDDRSRRDRSRSRSPNRSNHHHDDNLRYRKSKNDNKKYNNRSRNNDFDNNISVKKEDGASPDWGKNYKDDGNKKKTIVEKEKPNFGLSGKLTEDTNVVNGVVIKYSEPSDARKPKRRWRLYPFKGEKALPTLYVHRQSAYLLGRDRKVADIPLDHPSCSKQHAALQYRLVTFQRDGGGEGRRVRPYLIDLESANGTFVNNVKLEPKRFHELLERDVVKFGFSTREYVLLHEHSKDDELDDDVNVPNETSEKV